MALPPLIRLPFHYWCSSDQLQSVLVCDIWVATGWVCFINLSSVVNRLTSLLLLQYSRIFAGEYPDSCDTHLVDFLPKA